MVLLIIFIICIVYTIFQLYLGSHQRGAILKEKVNVESAIFDVVPGFELYTDELQRFQILFPGQPEVNNLKFNGNSLTHYKSLNLIDNENFAQYSVAYLDSEIFTKQAINVYLESYVKGKIIGLDDGAKVISNELTKYKGILAKEYLIEYLSEGIIIKNKGVVFISNGDPIDLSVSHPSTMNTNSIYFNEFINSFELK